MKLRRIFLFLILIFVFLLAVGIVFPVLPLYFNSVGFSVIEIGVTFSIFGVGLLVFDFMWGIVMDKVNRGLLMPVVVAIGCANFLLYVYSRSLLEIVVLQLILGLTISGAGMIGRVRMSELSDERDRGLAFGLFGSTFGLTVVLGSLVDSLLTNRSGYDLDFYTAAIIGVVSLAASLLFRPRTSRPVKIVSQVEGPPPRVSLTSRNLILPSLVALAITASYGFFTSLMPVIVTKSIPNASASEAVLTVGIFNGGALIFQPIMGLVGSRRPKFWICVGMVLNAVVLLSFTVSNSILAVFLLTFVAGASYAIVSPVSLSLLLSGVPSQYFGRFLGIYGASEDTGITIGPLIASLLWQLVDLRSAFLSLAVISVAALLVYLVADRSRR